MEDNIKIYIRNDYKIYTFINEEITYYEDNNLDEVLYDLKEEYEIDKANIDIILHFSKIYMKENENKMDILKNMLKYTSEKFYVNHIINSYINFYLENKKINEIKQIAKKYKYNINSIKIDICCLYNYFKSEKLDKEFLQIGENESIRIAINDEKIIEYEKIDLKESDVLNEIENFDFGNMEIIINEEENIKKIFLGESVCDFPNFIKKTNGKILSGIDISDLKNINVKDIMIILFLLIPILGATIFWKIDEKKNKIENMRDEIKKMEKTYLEGRKEEINNYNDEMLKIEEIVESIVRKDYYTFIKFLVESSKYGIEYININYKDKKWTIEGEILDFGKYEKFEKVLMKKYDRNKLNYIKDNEDKVVFEYDITVD